jgi:hypothetical protein
MVDLVNPLGTVAPSPLGDLDNVWKFVAVARWPSNAGQGDLSDAFSRSIKFDLLKPATMTLSIPGRSPQIDWLAALRSDILAYRWNDLTGTYVPMFRGVINHSEDAISPTTHTVTLTGTDYRGVFSRRLMRGPLSWTTAIEQSSLVQQIVAYGDQPTGYTGRLGLNYRLCNPDGTPLAATGVQRTRSYLNGQAIDAALDDISTDINGFDYSVEPDLNDPSATAVVTMWYPQRGVAKSNWVAHYGSTVTDVSRVVDATAYSSYALTIGNAAGLYAESYGPGWTDPVNNPEGAWMTVQTQNTVSVFTTLQQNSDGIIAMYGDLEPAYTLTLAPGRWSPADCWLGDVVRLIINSGRLKVDTDVRITQVGITLDEQGRETVALTAGILPVGAGELVRNIDRQLASLGLR